MKSTPPSTELLPPVAVRVTVAPRPAAGGGDPVPLPFGVPGAAGVVAGVVAGTGVCRGVGVPTVGGSPGRWL